MQSLDAIFIDLARRVGELERRLHNQSRTGVVAHVNAAEGTARVRLLDSDPPFLTGWIPWEEPAAGANKTHNPPSVGQQVKVYSESGDLHDASIQGSVNSNDNGRPSGQADQYILNQVGAASITISDGGGMMELKVGASSVTLTAGGITLNAPRIDLN